MDKVLIRTMTERIVADSRRFDMGWWATRDLARVAPCGTTFCFAGETVATMLPDAVFGHAIFVWQGVQYPYDAAAAEMLGLTPKQADRLFHTDEWPFEFLDRYRRIRWQTDATKYTQAERRAMLAKVLQARVEHFLKTNGQE